MLQAQLVGVGVVTLCAGELAQTDGHHFEQTAFDLAAEVGVPFDAADEHYAVAVEGVLIHESLDAVGCFPERHHVQRADDRAAHCSLVNAVLGQNCGLPLGGSGAVTAHGREDERPAALRFPIVHHTACDGRDIGDTAAANADGHTRSGFHARGEMGSGELAADLARNVTNRAVREFLTNREQAGNQHDSSIPDSWRGEPWYALPKTLA